MRKRLKGILLFLLTACTAAGAIFFVYAKKNPVTAKIDRVDVRDFVNPKTIDNEKLKAYKLQFENLDRNDKEGYNRLIQTFNDADDLVSDDPADYVRVYYYIDLKNNCYSQVAGINTLVSRIPENDPYFAFTDLLDPLCAGSFTDIIVQCNIIMCRKGLSDDEFKEKIRSVSLDVLFSQKNEAGKVQVEGIEKLDADKITFTEW